MADNKEYLVRNSGDGNVQISEEVICTIAAAAVLEVDGVENLNYGSTGVDSIADMLTKKNNAKLIHMTVNETALSLSCSISVSYGYDVVEVAKNVQLNVANAVSSMTGFNIEKVDVNVSSISLSKKK